MTIDTTLDTHTPEEYDAAEIAKEDLSIDILTAIRAELDNDPEGRGYAGKTVAEMATLLNTPYDPSLPPRINQILVGIPFTPNMVAPEDISNSLSL